MNIGIIINSHSGNTNSVAQQLKEKFSAAGHTAEIEEIIPAGDIVPRKNNISLKTRPELDKYEALVFGAPVNAFALSSAMATFLTELTSLANKKIACFVTKALPFRWTGGNQAMATMKKLCESKGATVLDTEIINWGNKSRREKLIADMVERFSKLF